MSRLLRALWIAIAVALLAPLLVGAAPAEAASRPAPVRVSGPDRIATAVAVSQLGWGRSDVVVLARADDPADALSGSAVAGRFDAPLLITDRDRLAPGVGSEIRRLGARRVILLGGPAALAETVMTAVRATGVERVERIAGPDRSATAAAAAAALAPAAGGDAYVVAGWPDALTVSAEAARAARAGAPRPILLTGATVPDATLAALDAHDVRGVTLVDSDRILPGTVGTRLSAAGATLQHAPGKSRYALSAAIRGASTRPLLIATGERFPDALGAGALAARLDADLLLVPLTVGVTALDMVSNAAELAPKVIVIGGPQAVDERYLQAAGGGTSSTTRPSAEASAPALTIPPASSADVVLRPGDDVAGVVGSSPAGTRFFLSRGVYRLVEVVAKDGMRFTGEPGTVLSGAKVLSGWQRASDGRWFVGGQSQQAPTYGVWGADDWENGKVAEPGSEQEVFYSEELFRDGRRVRHVNRLAEVDRPGTWFFDYDADRIWMFDAPGSSVLETSVASFAFRGEGTEGVVIENLEVRNYATRSKRGPINADKTVGWQVRHVTVRDNHGAGIYVGPGMRVSHSRVVGNGQFGIGGNGQLDGANPIVVENNEIAHNRQLGFLVGWEAGGVKFAKTRNMVFANNWVHHNVTGKAVWFDIDNAGVVIRDNLIEDNGSHGIFYEISYDARITGNVVRNNRGGMGIFIVDSSDVEVDRNLVHGNPQQIFASHQNRKTLSLGPTGVRNLDVHHNDLSVTRKGNGIHRTASATTDPWAAGANNRFHDNVYRGSATSGSWWWAAEELDWDEWRALGQDTGSRMLSTTAPPAGTAGFTRVTYGPVPDPDQREPAGD